MQLEDLFEKYELAGERFNIEFNGTCWVFNSNTQTTSSETMGGLLDNVAKLPLICHREIAAKEVMGIKLGDHTPSKFTIRDYRFEILGIKVCYGSESWVFNPGDWLIITDKPLGVVSHTVFAELVDAT